MITVTLLALTANSRFLFFFVTVCSPVTEVRFVYFYGFHLVCSLSGIMAFSPLCHFAPGLFAPWLVRPFLHSPSG